VTRPALLAPSYRETCYWLEDADVPRPERAEPPRDADVVVVGAGNTGMAAAWEIARQGRSVAVLERHSLGWGASTRNGGMVLPDVKHAGVAELERRHGVAGGAIYAATLDAVRLVERLVDEHGIDCSYERTGHLELAHCPSALPDLRDMAAVYADDLGLEARLLSRPELAGEIGSTAFPGALQVSFSGGIHPARYFAGLAKVALGAGVVVCEETPATGLRREGHAHHVDTPRGSIRAGEVLVATDGYTDRLLPWLRRRMIPVGSYIIATEPLDPSVAAELSPRGRMFFDTKNFLSYWRLSPDRTRMLFGGRASFAPTTVTRARNFLYERMVRIHPQLIGVPVEFAWGGTVGLTVDRTPRLGRRDGITYALGYSGTGVAASTYYGLAAGSWLCGGDSPAFAGLRFPAVPLSFAQPVTLPVAGLWFKWQDRCRE
jgi:glycine/D-amino acid oxidase-like deaminating enzyme